MKATTVIKVSVVYQGKVIATATHTLENHRQMSELAYAIGYVTQDAAKWAMDKQIDMTVVDCSFTTEIRHLYDGHL